MVRSVANEAPFAPRVSGYPCLVANLATRIVVNEAPSAPRVSGYPSSLANLVPRIVVNEASAAPRGCGGSSAPRGCEVVARIAAIEAVNGAIGCQ